MWGNLTFLSCYTAKSFEFLIISLNVIKLEFSVGMGNKTRGIGYLSNLAVYVSIQFALVHQVPVKMLPYPLVLMDKEFN